MGSAPDSAYSGRVSRLWAFAPFLVIGVIHLAALFLGIEPLSGPTKYFLMPALLLGFLIALPRRRTELALVGSAAIVLSWLGDVLLASPGDLGFLIGLGFFLLAHLAYIAQFTRSLRLRRVPLIALVYVPWWVVLLIALTPHAGALVVPVALYGAVLAVSAATALGANRTVAVGALIFFVSDTLLGFKMFWPGFSLWQADFLIMLAYITGQGLIALGSVRHAQRSVGDALPA
jgi:uncharacterized membrane protein YhhN